MEKKKREGKIGGREEGREEAGTTRSFGRH